MTMRPRSIRVLFASLAFAVAGFMGGCDTAEPPPAETVLWLKLNDSLSRYDAVYVYLVNRQTSDTVARLWDKPLRNPASDIPGFPLNGLQNQGFIVKVVGYKAGGQVALETLIYYEGGKKSVLHTEVAPLKPIDRLVKLKPSVGVISPAFNRDSLNYKVTLPAGITSLTFALEAENPSASLSFDGESVVSGTSTKPVTVGTKPDTIKATVIDMSTGTASMRTYTVILFPTLPPGLYLASIKPTVGTLDPEFSQTTQIYTLNLPMNIDTVAFFVTPADSRTMNVTINGKAIFQGAKSEVFHVDPGAVVPVPISVNRGEDMSFYQVTITRFPPP